MNFGSTIIHWYQKNKRTLPWRDTHNPYLIWLSEIILQQTRVEQGKAYYLRFAEKYPTIKKLAAAKEDNVLKLWQGLGYYSRARNLHHTAKEIVKQFKGKFPEKYEDILSLKGIGQYTAAAIASFAYNQKYAVVDGNVMRFLSRVFGIATPINSSKAKKEFFLLANELLEKHSPADFNQALIEFGALQCKPANPDCVNCPLNHQCYAFEKNLVKKLPVKSKAIKVRHRYFHYLVIHHNKKIFLRKRTLNDIWKNLYDFPSIETPKNISFEKLIANKEWVTVFGKKKIKIISVGTQNIVSLLSHQTIHAKFYGIKIEDNKFIPQDNWQPVTKTNLKKFAVPKLIENYLKEIF